jgi:hypothetical protein
MVEALRIEVRAEELTPQASPPGRRATRGAGDPERHMMCLLYRGRRDKPGDDEAGIDGY